METLAPVWACDPRDLSDLRAERPCVWESPCVFNVSPPPAGMWAEPLSPHLQRNKQLHDTLLQREEELARLQEENNKLRQFFSSSFVRNLQLKAKKLSADGRRKLKRNLVYPDLPSQQVSKRVCRNLTAEFCSESPETSSEPNLDLWVLRTLGLKDRDTIDTSDSSSGYSTLLYDHTASSSSPPESSSLCSSFCSSFSSSSTPPSVHSGCQTLTPQTEYGYGAEHQETDSGSPVKSPQSNGTSPGRCSDATPDVVIRSSDITAFMPSPREPAFTQTPDQSQTSAPSPVQTPYWSPLSQTPSQDAIQFSPFCPVACSSPILSQLKTPVHDGNPTSPLTPTTPQTPPRRTDLAFSMSLSPSSSVKTHSYPQGQAFVRKDRGGRWNFTWVPRQGP
ncbi:geminin coiled-coil domain-containing protein 1 [Halichoeres trimaculatus]|uniref:geminin coiled-coil domain-containing protein 1 n=1 Tax=Halichoeres trimaculatus TaxID=147232 RepID=UPI003D9EC8B9